jgi:trk system potassium uptake protein TrkA
MQQRRFLVIGLGRFGSAVAVGLSKSGCEVVAVDHLMEYVEAVKDRVSYAIQLDATNTDALRSIDARSCEAAIIAMGGDFEASVMSVVALKDAGVLRVIARARDGRQARVLRAVGAAEVLEVESEVGRQLAERLFQRSDSKAGA